MANRTVTIGIPTLAALVLALIGGAAQVINYSVISAGSQLHASIAVVLLFLTALGIPPLTGQAFRAALHLAPWLSYLISAAMSAAMLALTTIAMPASAHEWIAAGLTVASALGFSASVAAVPIGGPASRVPS